MERVKKFLKMPDKPFKRIVGTTKPVFQQMMTVLKAVYEKLHESDGNPRGLTISDKPLLTLEYCLSEGIEKVTLFRV